MPVIDDINAEKKKFKFMSPKEKFQYIWDYYKVPIIVAVGIVLLVFFIARDLIANNRETYLYACMLNSNYSYDTDTTLVNGFVNYADVDTDAMLLNIDLTMHIDLEEADQMSLAYQQKIMALFTANDLDVLVGDEPIIAPYAENAAFLNPEEYLPDDLKKELEQKGFTYYTAKLEDGTTVPAGIYLDGCKRFEEDGELGTYSQDVRPIFAVAHNTERLDHSIEYLRFLISKN